MNLIEEYNTKKVDKLKGDPGPYGKFDWKTRAFAPGLDVGAVRLGAIRDGYLSVAGPHDAGGPLAEFMALAFASLHDKAVASTLGLREWSTADTAEAAGLTRFGYAMCVRVAQLGIALHEVTDIAERVAGLFNTSDEIKAMADTVRRLVNKVQPQLYMGATDGWATGPSSEGIDPELEPGAAVCLKCGGDGGMKCEPCKGTGEVHA
jgi:hypothetical protein